MSVSDVYETLDLADYKEPVKFSPSRQKRKFFFDSESEDNDNKVGSPNLYHVK